MPILMEIPNSNFILEPIPEPILKPILELIPFSKPIPIPESIPVPESILNTDQISGFDSTNNLKIFRINTEQNTICPITSVPFGGGIVD